MYLGKNYTIPFFAIVHAIAWAKQSELVLKKISLINILTWHSHAKPQVIDLFYHHDLAKILFSSMCLATNHMMSIFACDRCLNVTPNFRCYNFA